MNLSEAVTVFGVSGIVIYVIVQISSFYGLSVSSYGVYLAFYILFLVFYMVLPRGPPEI